jgi:hypothetical protein
MGQRKEDVKRSKREVSEGQRTSENDRGPISFRADGKCPKPAEDCSTCKITDCPEEEV